MQVNAGKLRHRVQIEEQSTERDTFGQSIDQWCVIGKAWADLVPLTGTEGEDARQYHATATTKIVLRYRRGFRIQSHHRITYRGRVFEIGYIMNEDELNHTLEVLTSELRK